MDETDLMDWVLSKKDGSIEGDILGKFLAIVH
jgi:hypothetical protein